MTERTNHPLFTTQHAPNGNFWGLCLYITEDLDCMYRSRKMGSQEKAEAAVKDHLRDMHGVDL